MQTPYLLIALLRHAGRLALCMTIVVTAGAFAAEPAADRQQPSAKQFEQRVRELIERLGDDDFFAREQAQRELAKLAFEAFEALDAATNHEDLEVAARARRLLQSMKVQWTSRDDSPTVQKLLAAYDDLSTSDKRARMRALAELPDGQGVAALCRMVRYEKSSVLSKAAALELLAMVPRAEPPPNGLTGTLRKHLNSSHRPAAGWLLTRIQFDDDPAAAADRWEQLVEAEHTRLKNTPERTSDRIVATLVRIQVEMLKRLQRNDQAGIAMRRLLALERGNPETLAKLLDWLVDQKAWKEIDELAERFQSRFASRPMLLYTVARAQTERGDPQLAEKTATRALALNPGSDSGPLTIHYSTARQLHSRGLTEWAERECRHVVRTGAAKEPVARMALAQLLTWLVEEKSWKKIDALGSEFETRLAGSPLLFYTLAQSQAEQGNAQQAEQTAQRALKLHPGNDAEAILEHLRVSRVLQKRGMFPWAKLEFRHVIRLGQPGDSTVVSAQYFLAEMLHDLGEDLEAGRVFQELVDGVAKRPGHAQVGPATLTTFRARAAYFQACHWESRKDTAKQRQFLEKALQVDDADLDVLIACHRLPGQTPEFRAKIKRLIGNAAAGLREEIVEEPNDPAGYNQFAWLVGNTGGDLDEALRYSQKSIELSPNSGGYYDTLAHVHFAMGQYEKAVETQTKAAELEPHSGVIRRKLEEFRKKAEEEKNE